MISLRDAYRVMERFVRNYLDRGDTSVSDFLHAYASRTADGSTTDPASVADFVEAADQILPAD